MERWFHGVGNKIQSIQDRRTYLLVLLLVSLSITAPYVSLGRSCLIIWILAHYYGHYSLQRRSQYYLALICAVYAYPNIWKQSMEVVRYCVSESIAAVYNFKKFSIILWVSPYYNIMISDS